VGEQRIYEKSGSAPYDALTPTAAEDAAHSKFIHQGEAQPGDPMYGYKGLDAPGSRTEGDKSVGQAPPATAEDVSRWGDKSLGQAPPATAEDVARWGDRIFSTKDKSEKDKSTKDKSASAPGYAEGGEVNGPGTTTSDSIFARLSRGEFVTQAKAVAYWGADFMHAVNNMQLPGFATGGLVPSPVRMGGGSIAPATSTLNLSIDGRSFNGLKGPKSTIDDLSSFAVARQTSAAGSNPSWMK
jgi:hypothetical protein